jgi:prepilin-type N-terminal cleavage/methylation domain-containing protein
MTSPRQKPGLTLIEILLAVAIVAMLVTVTAVSTATLRRQAQVRLTESTIAVISSALQQYNEFYGKYPPQVDPSIDLTDSAKQRLLFVGVVNHASDATAALRVINKTTGAVVPPVPATAIPLPANVQSEVLYLYLSGVPASRSIVSKLSDQMAVSELDTSGNAFVIYWTTPRQEWRQLFWLRDAWGKPLSYQYNSGDPYPVLTSAGPDKKFDSPTDRSLDDIKSSGK